MKMTAACMTVLAALAMGTAGQAAARPAACDMDGSQRDLNACAWQRVARADAEMNRLYGQQMKRVGAESRARLRDAQRAWIAYRDKSCLYEAGPREGAGTVWPMVDALCREGLTKQRSVILEQYSACAGAPCPE